MNGHTEFSIHQIPIVKHQEFNIAFKLIIVNQNCTAETNHRVSYWLSRWIDIDIEIKFIHK